MKKFRPVNEEEQKLIQQAEDFLIEEWKALPKDNMAGILRAGQESARQIGESRIRFPLSLCGSADKVRLLAHLFLFTAEECRGTVEGLEEKLEILKDMHIPGMESWMAAWKQEGYPPVHHSRIYREAYQPHYRLAQKKYGDFFLVRTGQRILHRPYDCRKRALSETQ